MANSKTAARKAIPKPRKATAPQSAVPSKSATARKSASSSRKSSTAPRKSTQPRKSPSPRKKAPAAPPAPHPAPPVAPTPSGPADQSLQTFTLTDLQGYTQEGVYSNTASNDFHLFYVGRDDVHSILKYVLSRVSVSLYLNMFGYDDDELNAIIMSKAANPHITVVITLDKSQSGGAHEKQLLDSDFAQNAQAYNTSFVIGQSSTHQISHTKGFVADGKVAGEGSTNWSGSGEGTFITPGKIGGAGYKAQNNTQSIITDADTIGRFTAQLIAEHLAARADQSNARSIQTGAVTPPMKQPVTPLAKIKM
jgi:hypothetical protein